MSSPAIPTIGTCQPAWGERSVHVPASIIDQSTCQPAWGEWSKERSVNVPASMIDQSTCQPARSISLRDSQLEVSDRSTCQPAWLIATCQLAWGERSVHVPASMIEKSTCQPSWGERSICSQWQDDLFSFFTKKRQRERQGKLGYEPVDCRQRGSEGRS